MDSETLPSQSTDPTASNVDDAVSDAPATTGDSTDRLVLMVRDPTSAFVYWDISLARTQEAFTSLGGGKAFLRLIELPTEHLLAEQEVAAERGSASIRLPEADRSYAAELVVTHHYTKVVLARSNPIQSPPTTPRAGAGPVIVSRDEQRRAMELGLALDSRGVEPSAPLPHDIAGAPNAQGSEARLSASGSEQRLAK